MDTRSAIDSSTGTDSAGRDFPSSTPDARGIDEPIIENYRNAIAASHLRRDRNIVGESDQRKFTSRRTVVQRLGEPVGGRIPRTVGVLGLRRQRPEAVGINQLRDHSTRTPQVFDAGRNDPSGHFSPAATTATTAVG